MLENKGVGSHRAVARWFHVKALSGRQRTTTLMAPGAFQKEVNMFTDAGKEQNMLTDAGEQSIPEKPVQGDAPEPEALERHILYNYIYERDPDILEKFPGGAVPEKWKNWKCAILIQSGHACFDSLREDLVKGICEELRRDFFYLNLNVRQSLMLFSDERCDYALVASHIYLFLKRRYPERFYLACSRRFNGYTALPGILYELEQQMVDRFYHPENRIYLSYEDMMTTNAEAQDSELVQKISEDVGRKDIERVWKHFGFLKEKYQKDKRFSAMYVKFVFSNVLQEIYSEEIFAEKYSLADEVERLYRCETMEGILQVVEDSIYRYEVFLKESVEETRARVLEVKEFVEENCEKDISAKRLARKFSMTPGHLSYVFKMVTGLNLHHYVHVCRMKRAKALCEEGRLTAEEICTNTGFAREEYLRRRFYEFWGREFPWN